MNKTLNTQELIEFFENYIFLRDVLNKLEEQKFWELYKALPLEEFKELTDKDRWNKVKIEMNESSKEYREFKEAKDKLDAYKFSIIVPENKKGEIKYVKQ